MIAQRFGGLDEGLVSRDRRAIREKIETEPKIRKWLRDLTSLSTPVKDLTPNDLLTFSVQSLRCQAIRSFSRQEDD